MAEIAATLPENKSAQIAKNAVIPSSIKNKRCMPSLLFGCFKIYTQPFRGGIIK